MTDERGQYYDIIEIRWSNGTTVTVRTNPPPVFVDGILQFAWTANGGFVAAGGAVDGAWIPIGE